MKKLRITLVALALWQLAAVVPDALAVEFFALHGWYGGSGIVGSEGILQNGGGLEGIGGVEFNRTVLYFETGPLLEAPAAIPPHVCGGPLVPCVPFEPFAYRWDGGGEFVIESGFRWETPITHIPPTRGLAGDVTGARLDVTAWDPEFNSWIGTFTLDLDIEEGPDSFRGPATLTMPIRPVAYLVYLGLNGELLSVPEHATLTLVPTPEPTTLFLLATGFAGMGGLGMWWGRDDA